MRQTSSSTNTALQQSNVPLIVFVELDFPSGMLRLCNASHDVVWNAYTWVGLGNIASIEGVSESDRNESKGVVLTLSGVPSSNLALAFVDNTQGRTGRIYAAPLQEVANPAPGVPGFQFSEVRTVFVGRMDAMTITDGGDSATVRIPLEDRRADLRRARVSYYNTVDQQAKYPGDLGFQYVDSLVSDKKIKWGSD